MNAAAGRRGNIWVAKMMNPNLEDQELLESYESGEWRPVNSLQREVKHYQEYAASWLEKNLLVNLALPVSDFDQLKKKANTEDSITSTYSGIMVGTRSCT